MLVQVPGIAFGAIKDNGFPQESTALWKRIQDYSVRLARGRGITVNIDLDWADWQVVRRSMLQLVRELDAMSYAERGLEGSVIMRSLQVAIGRIDDALK